MFGPVFEEGRLTARRGEGANAKCDPGCRQPGDIIFMQYREVAVITRANFWEGGSSVLSSPQDDKNSMGVFNIESTSHI